MQVRPRPPLRIWRQNRLSALAVTLGPAAIDAFGYFRTFPDAPGTDTKLHNDSLLQRWSNLARTSSGVDRYYFCQCADINTIDNIAISKGQSL